jgi:hypothetical protein
MNKVILGAPSLTGKDANDLVAAHFKDAAFPLMLVVANLSAFPLSFPEIIGLFLKPCTHIEEATVTVEVPNYEALQRLASSIEQVAELNGSSAMLELSVFDPNADTETTEETTGDETGAALDGDGVDAESAENTETTEETTGEAVGGATSHSTNARGKNRR